LNDAAARLDLSFVDIGVLLAEREIRLKVPDESTLQKRLKNIWAMFAPEARRKAG